MKRPSAHPPRPERCLGRERVPEQEDVSTRLVDLTPYYGHLACFRGLRPLMVKTNRFTYAPSYPPNDRMQNTWLSIALEGIEALYFHHGNAAPWTDLAVIGTGNGLDAVGISRIVHPRTIIASDIHPICLDAARWNVANYVGEECRVSVLESDLFERYPPGSQFDLIYENLPNIPDGDDLFEGIRSASCYTPKLRGDRTTYDRHLLTLHRELLLQAHSHLRDSGWVVGVIGGRVPWTIIEQMFRDAGYRPLVAGFGVKIQSEADVVLPAYAAAERETGVTFAYYHPLEACLPILSAMPQPEEIAAREDYARRLTERLAAHRIPSTEAARRHASGEAVCHSVYVIAAQRDRGARADG